MRRLAVTHSTRFEELLDALETPGALALVLQEAPTDVSRLDLLLACLRAEGPLVVRFSGALGTPLVEVACLAMFASWETGSTLDLRGALLTPLVLGRGPGRARKVLLQGPSGIDPAAVLARAPEGLDASEPWDARSPLALALLRPLLLPPHGSYAAERASFGLALAAADRLEGVSAFREKRAPLFRW